MRKKIRYLTTYKKYNINTWTVGVPEGEERVKGKKLLKEIMAKNFIFIKNCKPTDSGNSVNPSHKNMKKTIPWYIITKLLKTSCKEKFLKMPEKTHVIRRGAKIKGDVKSSLAKYNTSQRHWKNSFKVLKERNS